MDSPHVTHCLRCSRQLTNPVSMYVGFGPICSELLGIKRPEYNELMKLNPENDTDLATLLETREKLEKSNNVEGSLFLDEDQVVIKFRWGCQNFDEIKAVVKKYAAKWNPEKKQWEAPTLILSELITALHPFQNIAVDESLYTVIPNSTAPPSNSEPSKLESLAMQMKKRIEGSVEITTATLKNGLSLWLKRAENGSYKVFCARDDVLPSRVEVRVIGDSFLGKGQWEFGKAKTTPPLPSEGYVIRTRKEEIK